MGVIRENEKGETISEGGEGEGKVRSKGVMEGKGIVTGKI